MEVCITVMPGSSPNQETFNLFTQPSANTGEIESHVSSESAKLPFIPISPSHTHTHTHTPYTQHIYTHTYTEAMEISDYSLQEGSLTNGSASVVLNSTASRGCITIDTVNDQIPEQMESLRIVLRFVDGNLFLDPNRLQTVVVILDNTGNHCITAVFWSLHTKDRFSSAIDLSNS